MRLRPSVLAAVMAATLSLLPATGRGDPMAFLHRIEDIPLAPGLVEQAAAGLSFVTPEGRIVEAVAAGKVSAEQITSFYAATLPELGWVERAPMKYRRDSELLSISLSPAPGGLTVAFSLQPVR